MPTQHNCVFILIILSAYEMGKISGTAKDLTLVPGSSGEDVVEACIQKIENLDLFTNDSGLMKRIAELETNFGIRYESNTQHFGIWQISSKIQSKLQNSYFKRTIMDSIAKILPSFTDLAQNFSSIDYTIPLHSAVAAKLYITLIRDSNVLPDSLDEHVKWWKSNYRLRRFIDESEQNCFNNKIDLWFCLDGSGSVGKINFNKSLAFINELAAEFTISPNHVRTGFSVYSTSVNTISYFNQHTTSSTFKSAVSSAYYPEDLTNTGLAISDAVNSGFQVSNGARPPAERIPRVLILVTDGRSGDSIASPVATARNAGITVFAVGVGDTVNVTEINEIASDPNSKYAYTVDDFDSLFAVLKQQLLQELCIPSAIIRLSIAVSVNLASRSVQHFSVLAPCVGNITLVFNVTSTAESSGTGYIGTLPNPNSALHTETFILEPASMTPVIHVITHANEIVYLTIISTGNSDLSFTLLAFQSIDSSPDPDLKIIGGVLGGHFIAFFIFAFAGLYIKIRANDDVIQNPSAVPSTSAPFIQTNDADADVIKVQDTNTVSPADDNEVNKIERDLQIYLEKGDVNGIASVLGNIDALNYDIKSWNPNNEKLKIMLNKANQINNTKGQLQTDLSRATDDLDFLTRLQATITSAGKVDFPKNNELMVNASKVLQTLKNKQMKMNRIKTDLRKSSLSGDLQTITKVLEQAEKLEYLTSWNPHDKELMKLLEDARQGKAELILQKKIKSKLQNGLNKACSSRNRDDVEKALNDIDKAKSKHLLQECMLNDHTFMSLIERGRCISKNLKKLEKRKDDIKKLQLSEVKGYIDPPPVVIAVMQATYILLGEEHDLMNWRSIQAKLRKLGESKFKDKVFKCNPAHINLDIAKKATSHVAKFHAEDVKRQSKAVVSFWKWVYSILTEVYDRNDQLKHHLK